MVPENHLRFSFKMHLPGSNNPPPLSFHCRGLEWSLEICIFNQLLDDSDDGDTRATLGEALGKAKGADSIVGSVLDTLKFSRHSIKTW